MKNDLKSFVDRLRFSGLRPTEQRVMICKALFSRKETFHFTIVQLKKIIEKNTKCKVSLATIYNVLNDFVNAGLMNKIIVDKDVAYFDTNINNHYHFYIEDQKKLVDIDPNSVHISKLPKIPSNYKLKNVDIFLTLKNK